MNLGADCSPLPFLCCLLCFWEWLAHQGPLIEPRVQPPPKSGDFTQASLPPASVMIWLLLFIQQSDLQTLLLEFRSLSCSTLSPQANNGNLYPNQRTEIKAVDRIACISCFLSIIFLLKLLTPIGILCKVASFLAQLHI